MDKYLSTGSCTTKKKATHMLWGGVQASPLGARQSQRCSQKARGTSVGHHFSAYREDLMGVRRGGGREHATWSEVLVGCGVEVPVLFSSPPALLPLSWGVCQSAHPLGRWYYNEGGTLRSLERDLTETGWGRIAGVRCIDPSFRRPRPHPLLLKNFRCRNLLFAFAFSLGAVP